MNAKICGKLTVDKNTWCTLHNWCAYLSLCKFQIACTNTASFNLFLRYTDIVRLIFNSQIFSVIIDGGVNLKVRRLTGTWGGCRHRNAKIWGKKGRFCENLAKTGGATAPPGSAAHGHTKALSENTHSRKMSRISATMGDNQNLWKAPCG